MRTPVPWTAVLLLIAASSTASPIRFDFTGAHVSGATVSGHFTYELSTPDSDPGLAETGYYETGTFHATTSLGQVFDYGLGDLYVVVQNDHPSSIPGLFDGLLIFIIEPSAPHTNLLALETSRVDAPAAFASDALPTALDLAAFDPAYRRLYLPGAAPGTRYSYVIDTLTTTPIPEPSALAVLAAGLALLGARRRWF